MNIWFKLFFSIFLLFLLISCSTESETAYQLNVSIEPNEAGSVTPTQGEYDEGEIVELTATANENWIFNGWQGGLTGNLNPATITMSSDKNIIATFKKQEFNLTINIIGEGEVDQTVLQSKSTDYPYGSEVELSANPSFGWVFTGWSGDLNSENSKEVVEVFEELEITATFEEGVRDNEGNFYNVVEIGDQLWMADNLRASMYQNGDEIPNISNNAEWQNVQSGAWSFYNNDSQFDETYGKLYNWYAANDNRNICPEGWKVPSVTDLRILNDYLGQNAGGKVKATGFDYWDQPNTGASNETGLTILPAGGRDKNGDFYNEGKRGYIWSQTELDDENAFYRILESNSGDFIENDFLKIVGRSVRCLAN